MHRRFNTILRTVLRGGRWCIAPFPVGLIGEPLLARMDRQSPQRR
jgi:hypothetical protein